MSKVISAILCSILLSACTPNPTIVTEVVYTTKTASIEQKTLPQRELPADIKTDDELATFMLETERYIKLIVKKFNDLVLFYEGGDNK